MTFAPDLLAGRVALVTGATSGIGRAVARRLHGLGAEVHAVGLAAADADLPHDRRLHVTELDVTDDDALAALVDPLPRLDVLVHAAGITLGRPERQRAGFSHVLDVNLTSPMVLTWTARGALRAASGAVVLVGSTTSYRGFPQGPAYAASKAGVVTLTSSLAQLLAPDGVRVNAVAPGYVTTPLSRGASDAMVAASEARIPLGAWGEPEDVADVVTFLVSPAARYVTGVVLPVDGGYLTT